MAWLEWNPSGTLSSPVQGPKKDIAVIDVDPEPFPSIPRAIILDLSPVNFLDTVGVKALQNVWRSKINKKKKQTKGWAKDRLYDRDRMEKKKKKKK